ncbi:hypothetical protein [Glaciihabitans sp. dw_435]|uniref:hypothetical protein n=1 Tax=Glaciihabitans sp. dw_435 TaxID=2720081 RepID=UPI001BD25660|nr:hypothetical protein [Glaciihabitans sp. dw_435]
MSYIAAPSVLSAADLDPVRGVLIAVVTLVVVVVIGLAIALTLLFRRREGARPSAAAGISELEQLAGSALLRADDAVAAGDDELAYAIAQFGEERTREFASAVASAHASVTEAFRLKQQLDDAYADTDVERRDWNNRIVALSESAQRSLQTQSGAFDTLRRAEADSPRRLTALREGIATSRGMVPAAQSALDYISSRYAPETVVEVRDNVAQATALLDQASAEADDAAAHIDPTGVNSVSSTIDASVGHVISARRLLAAVSDVHASLRQADAALTTLVADTRRSLEEARAARDAAPDADTGAALVAAIASVEQAVNAAVAGGGAGVSAGADALSTSGSPDPDSLTVGSPISGSGIPDSATSLHHPNPARAIAQLGEAVTELDTALAGARNQQQRLEHARTALAGALVAARSQISVVKNYMSGGRAAIEARTRLAEAERQLMLAEAEADPVEALDAARRAATSARDADALARYEAL